MCSDERKCAVMKVDFCKDETTAPSTVGASGNAIGPERHVIAEGYRLVM